MSHGGTFNGNPVAAAAGLATLRELTPDRYERLAELGERLRTRPGELDRRRRDRRPGRRHRLAVPGLRRPDARGRGRADREPDAVPRACWSTGSTSRRAAWARSRRRSRNAMSTTWRTRSWRGWPRCPVRRAGFRPLPADRGRRPGQDPDLADRRRRRASSRRRRARGPCRASAARNRRSFSPSSLDPELAAEERREAIERVERPLRPLDAPDLGAAAAAPGAARRAPASPAAGRAPCRGRSARTGRRPTPGSGPSASRRTAAAARSIASMNGPISSMS